MPHSVKFFDVLDSTNSYIKRNAAEMSDGDVIAARSQTGGRGRLGRQFFSPGGGLYFSLLLKRKIPIDSLNLLTPLAAVAVCDALESCGVKTGIKWVNDVYVGRKKVCGILVESPLTQSGEAAYSVVGAGINLTEPEGGFPPEISERAGAAFKKGFAPPPEELLKEILSAFDRRLGGLFEREFLFDYRARSVVIGREITVLPLNAEPYKAVAVKIDDDCRLIVDTPNGQKTLFTGEVSIKL